VGPPTRATVPPQPPIKGPAPDKQDPGKSGGGAAGGGAGGDGDIHIDQGTGPVLGALEGSAAVAGASAAEGARAAGVAGAMLGVLALVSSVMWAVYKFKPGVIGGGKGGGPAPTISPPLNSVRTTTITSSMITPPGPIGTGVAPPPELRPLLPVNSLPNGSSSGNPTFRHNSAQTTAESGVAHHNFTGALGSSLSPPGPVHAGGSGWSQGMQTDFGNWSSIAGGVNSGGSGLATSSESHQRSLLTGTGSAGGGGGGYDSSLTRTFMQGRGGGGGGGYSDAMDGSFMQVSITVQVT